MASILSAAHFHNEEAAYAFVEARIWPHGPTCVHCGGTKRVGKLAGKSTRIGVYKCYDCRKPFTVKLGTIFEDSRVPMRLWLQGIYLIASSKKGISSHQLHRTLGVTLKTAWFMSHRVRDAMRVDGAVFGTGGGTVEVDETFIGNDRTIKPHGVKKGRGYHHKNKVLALVDRTTGQSRSMVVDNLKAKTLLPILQANIDKSARVMTDEPDSIGTSARTSLDTATPCTVAVSTFPPSTRPSTPIPSKACSACSSAAWSACTSIAATTT